MQLCCNRTVSITSASNEWRYPFGYRHSLVGVLPSPGLAAPRKSNAHSAWFHALHDQQEENDVAASRGIAAEKRKGVSLDRAK